MMCQTAVLSRIRGWLGFSLGHTNPRRLRLIQSNRSHNHTKYTKTDDFKANNPIIKSTGLSMAPVGSQSTT